MIEIPRPSKNEVEIYLNEWNSKENYVVQEETFHKLFCIDYPQNNDIRDILVKVCAINDLYNTNIFAPYYVAKHILDLRIDERLKSHDELLVNEIAELEIKDKKKHFYSFASKYCNKHQPEFYPIFDRYVEKVLMYFKKKDKFYSFKKNDLRNYSEFKKVLLNFQKFYNIEEYSLRKIDKYLWLLGQEYFSKKSEEEVNKK